MSFHDTFEEVISKQNKTLRSMTADTSSQTDPPPSDAESEPTQVDTPPLPQPTHPPPTTDQQKDTAQVTDHQSNDQQDNVDALPPKPTPTPPNSAILGLNVVNSNESRESSSANTVGSQTEIDANPDGSIDGDHDVTCRFYLQGRCKHGKMGKDCAFKHPPMCFKFVRIEVLVHVLKEQRVIIYTQSYVITHSKQENAIGSPASSTTSPAH